MSRKSRKEVEAIVSAMGVFMGIISNLVELVKKLGGTMESIYRLATPEGVETLEVVARVIASGANKARNEFLHLISGGQAVIIDAVSGMETLANAKDVFAYIDSDFKNWGADERGLATEKTPVDVHEMVKDATFSQMFGKLSTDVRKLCLAQAQIKNFAQKHRGWLRTGGYGTFFLFESNGQLFVASVGFDSGGSLRAYVRRFEYSYVWDADGRHRFVVPRLA